MSQIIDLKVPDIGDFAEVPVIEVFIKPGDVIKLGCFEVEFFAVNHSIPGALGIFLRSPAGNVLHTGDFKFDFTPMNEPPADFQRLAALGQARVDGEWHANPPAAPNVAGINWQTIGLWAVLLLGVAALGGMAYSLLRKPPARP